MFRRIFSISLVILVLLSSTGYGFSAHFCGGKAVSFSLFGRPAGCGMEEDRYLDDPCKSQFAPDANCLQAKKCCSEQTVVVPGLQHLAESTKQTAALPAMITPASVSFLFLPQSSAFASSVKPRFGDYYPLVRTRDLPVLFRVFRI